MARNQDSGLALRQPLRKPQLAQWHFRSVGQERSRTPGAYSLRISLSLSSTGPTRRESSSLPSHIIRVTPITGGLKSKTANQLFEPTCEAHAAQQWRSASFEGIQKY